MPLSSEQYGMFQASCYNFLTILVKTSQVILDGADVKEENA